MTFKHQHIFLSGFMGTGKSSVAFYLSRLLHRPFIDLDQAIESLTQQTINQIFENQGEKKFRELETQALNLTIHQIPSVISLGGGAILKKQNREIIQKHIWINLNASASTIYSRIKNAKNRPVLGPEFSFDELKEKLNKRRPFYELAPYQIFTDSFKPSALAKIIKDKLGLKSHS